MIKTSKKFAILGALVTTPCLAGVCPNPVPLSPDLGTGTTISLVDEDDPEVTITSI